MQTQQNAYANQAQAYSQIVNPYEEGAYRNMQAAAQGYGGLASSYGNLANYENQQEQANSPFGQIGGLLSLAGNVEDVASKAGGLFRKPGGTGVSTPNGFGSYIGSYIDPSSGDHMIQTDQGTLDSSDPSKYGFQYVENWQAQDAANNPENPLSLKRYGLPL